MSSGLNGKRGDWGRPTQLGRAFALLGMPDYNAIVVEERLETWRIVRQPMK